MRLNRIFERFEDERSIEEEERTGRRRKARPEAGGLGFARRRDIEDRRSQEQAPPGGGRSYDRSGEQRYERGLERFELHNRLATRSDGRSAGAVRLF